VAGRTQWVFGGDGWAYDIGYGGLDHVRSTKSRLHRRRHQRAGDDLAYSPQDLGLMASANGVGASYGYVYVART